MRFFFVLGMGLVCFSVFYFFGTILFPLQKLLAFENQGANTIIILAILGCGFFIALMDGYIEALQILGISKVKIK